jgi:hypothetical protein
LKKNPKVQLTSQISPDAMEMLNEIYEYYNQRNDTFILIKKYEIVEKIIEEHYAKLFKEKVL